MTKKEQRKNTERTRNTHEKVIINDLPAHFESLHHYPIIVKMKNGSEHIEPFRTTSKK